MMREWGCRYVAVDATRVGAGLANWLEQEPSSKAVEQCTLTAPAKSRLGFLVLGMINTRRSTLFARDESEDARDCWREVELARY